MDNILELIKDLEKEEKYLELLKLDTEVNKEHDINKQFNIVKQKRRNLSKRITEYKAKNQKEFDLKVNLTENNPSEVFFKETFGRKITIDKEKYKPMLREKISAQIAALSDISLKEAEMIYDDTNTDEDMIKLFSNILKNNKREMIFLDIETTDINSSFGDIIELGLLVIDNNGDIIEKYNERFDLTHPLKSIKYSAGVGASEVHKIYPKDLDGKSSFNEKEVQDKLNKIINKPNRILVAHNDFFEYKWLETHLDNFFETYNKYSNQSIKRGFDPINKMLDTRVLSQLLFHDTDNSKLESFVEGNGLKYIDAHSAYPDAYMTYEAFNIFKKRINGQRPENIKIGA